MKSARIKAVVTPCNEPGYPYSLQVWQFFDAVYGWVYAGVGRFCTDEDDVRKTARKHHCRCIEWN